MNRPMRLPAALIFAATLLVSLALAASSNPAPVYAAQGATPVPGSDSRFLQTRGLTADSVFTTRLGDDGSVDVPYEGSAGEVIGISAQSGSGLDLMLELLAADGTRLAFNDNHEDDQPDLRPLDPFIAAVTLPETGVYTLRVSARVGGGGAAIQLLVSHVSDADDATAEASPAADTAESAPPPPAALAPPTATLDAVYPIEQTMTGSVPQNDSFRAQFDAQAGDVVTITVRATDNVLDPRVELLDGSGNVLAENDDHTTDDPTLGRYDAQIFAQVVEATATYGIRIRGFSGSGGQFEMTILREAGDLGLTPTPTAAITATPVSTDSLSHEELPVSLDVNEQYRYEFTGAAGDVYTIAARHVSGDVDPRLGLYFEEDALIAVSDDHGTSDPSLGFYDARIQNVILQRSGNYQIYLSGAQQTSGDVLLTIDEVAQGAPLGTGREEVRMGDVSPNGVTRETFDLREGDYFTITVRALTQDFDTQAALISPGGIVVADNDDHGTQANDLGFLDSRISNYRVLEDGTYTLEIMGYRGSTGTYAVTAEVLR